MNPQNEGIFNELGALPHGFSDWTIEELVDKLGSIPDELNFPITCNPFSS